MLKQAFIPYRGYYSTPFVRWQGAWPTSIPSSWAPPPPGGSSSRKGWDPQTIEYVLVGSTVYQQQWFYSGPWAAAMMGADMVPRRPHHPGLLHLRLLPLPGRPWGSRPGMFENGWCLLADRCSNGPHAVWPNPERPRRPDDLRGLVHGQRRQGPLGGRGHDPDRRERQQGSTASPAKSATP